MLSSEEIDDATQGLLDEISEYALELMGAICACLRIVHSPRDLMSAHTQIRRMTSAILADRRTKIDRAIDAAYTQAYVKSATQDITDAHITSSVAVSISTEARLKAIKAAQDFKRLKVPNVMAREAINDLVRRAGIIAQIGASAGEVSYTQAVDRAVKDLAAKGITAYTYRREVDGAIQTVRMNADAYVRQRMLTDVHRGTAEMTLKAAHLSGANLVAVSLSPTCRPSHAPWEGRTYQLVGSGRFANFYAATKYVGGAYADWVEGLCGYNCRHTFRIVSSPTRAKNPLDGTGYTQKDARDAVAYQRKLERDIRALKRERALREAGGLDTKAVNAAIRAKQRQMREHINRHKEILRRESWREQV